MFYASSHKADTNPQPKTNKNNLSIRGIERVTGCDNLVNEPFHVNLIRRMQRIIIYLMDREIIETFY